MIMTGANTSVNPKFLSDMGLKQAQSYANLQRGEPSVLSTATARTNFETKIQPKIDTANKAIQGVTQTQNRQPQQTQESNIPTELLNENETPEDKINREYLSRLDKQIENVKNVFNTSIFSQQTNAQGQINSLNRQLTERKSLMEDSFNRGIRGTETALQRSGISRYSPISAENFITMKEQEGINEISKLDQEYNSKVADINQALEANSMSLAAQLTQELGNIEEKALSLMKEQAKEATKINKEIRDRQIQSSRDQAVGDLMLQGISDPAEMINILGGDFTAEEIGKSIKNLTGAENEKKGSVDIQDYFVLKNEGMLPDFINQLPQQDQFGAYTSWRKGIEKGTVTPQGTLVANVKKVAPITDLNQVDTLPVSTLTKSIMAGYGKLKDLTPTDKAKVLEEMYEVGFQPQTYVMNKLNNLVTLYSAVPENQKGIVEGFIKPWATYTDKNVASFESAKEVLTREIARLNDVGMLSDQDVASYKSSMPSRMDNDLSIVLSKISGLGSTIAGQKAKNVGKTGVLEDGRQFIVSFDGETLLDPVTGEILEDN